MATPTRLTPRRWRSLTADGYLPVRSLLGGTDLARITARLALTACFAPGPPWRLND